MSRQEAATLADDAATLAARLSTHSHGMKDTSHLVGILATRGDKWCCLLCLRQFRSSALLRSHVERSKLHARTAAAAAAGGTACAAGASSAAEPPAARRALGGAKRPRDEPAGDTTDSGGSGGMSALERMQLFERRLKVDAKRTAAADDEKTGSGAGGGQPAEPPAGNPNRPAANPRTINNQQDWECAECGTYNFARVIQCTRCGARVGPNTRYLENQLNVNKHRRYQSLMQTDEEMQRFAAPIAAAPDHGGGGGGKGQGRASFSQ